MNRFIRLSSRIINTEKIIQIKIYPNRYYIDISHYHINGFNFFSIGNIASTYDTIIVCNREHPADYNIMTEWIQKST